MTKKPKRKPKPQQLPPEFLRVVDTVLKPNKERRYYE